MGTKKCQRCLEVKPSTEFYPDVRNRDGLYSYCKPCNIIRGREQRLRNRDRTRARDHQYKLKKYGMTPDQYFLLEQKQEGKCAICRKPPKSTRLAVDHDHSTGKIR